MKHRKLLKKILFSSKNVKFTDFVHLVEAFGFHLSRIKGSHHMFTHPEVDELVNLQEVNGHVLRDRQIPEFKKIGPRISTNYHELVLFFCPQITQIDW
jgi:predicted RNA binding protein YcfA (HicA-like mRNA interferase family)